MPVYTERYRELKAALGDKVQLVAVSKTKTTGEIRELYDLGQRDFGENYVQELLQKHEVLPKDIRWHFIGHLQSNKVKYIASFVHLIQGVDSIKLLREINKEGQKTNRPLDCLLQVHIASEETKFGFDEKGLQDVMKELQMQSLSWVRVRGLMGMATFTRDEEKIRQEFRYLHSLYERMPSASILSMGMTSDYRIAIGEGSNMVRIGSLLFGERKVES